MNFGKYRSGFVYADSAKEVASRVACSAIWSTGASIRTILGHRCPEGLLRRIVGDKLAGLYRRARPGGVVKAPAVTRVPIVSAMAERAI